MNIQNIIKELKELEAQLKHQKFKPYLLFQIQPIKNITLRNKIIRTLFGRTEKHTSTTGLMQKYQGFKISPSVFILPLPHKQEILSLLKKSHIKYSTQIIWKKDE